MSITRLAQSFILLLTIISLSFIITGCSSRFTTPGEEQSPPSSPPSASLPVPVNGRVQSNSEGAVAIDVEWVETGTEPDSLIFTVVMNTHSVALDQYDLKQLTVLRDDAGREYRPLSWDSPPGGHHRQGRLTFPRPDSLKQGTSKYLELVIRDIADVKERVLKWEL